MMKSLKNIFICVVLFISIILLSTTASAQIAPYLYFGGNYQYDVDTNQLTFTDNYADFVEYTNGDYDYGTDPIVGAPLLFGILTNNTSNSLVFSASTFTVDGYFTATLTNFVVNNSELMWGSLNNIQRLDGGTSQYVDELLANGGGIGNIYMSFTPTSGGVENFTADSSGAIGGIVAAPEPISAILFVAGGVALAIRRYSKKRI